MRKTKINKKPLMKSKNSEIKLDVRLYSKYFQEYLDVSCKLGYMLILQTIMFQNEKYIAIFSSLYCEDFIGIDNIVNRLF